MSNLKKEYLESIVPNLQKKFEYKNKHQILNLKKL
jgi:ribosomal protein L5